MNDLIDFNEPVIPELRVGATSSSTINRNVVNESLIVPHNKSRGVGTTSLNANSKRDDHISAIFSPSVVETLESFGLLTKQLVHFLTEFKKERSATVRKKVLNHHKVKTFILVYIIKFLRILSDVLKTRFIKDKLRLVRLKSLNNNRDYHVDAELSDVTARQINRLTSSILSDVTSVKGSLNNCLVMLNLTKDINLESIFDNLEVSRAKPLTLSYYYNMLKLHHHDQSGPQKIFGCCLVCGTITEAAVQGPFPSKQTVAHMANTTSKKAEIQQLGTRATTSHSGNNFYHSDCLHWWQNEERLRVATTTTSTTATRSSRSRGAATINNNGVSGDDYLLLL